MGTEFQMRLIVGNDTARVTGTSNRGWRIKKSLSATLIVLSDGVSYYFALGRGACFISVRGNGRLAPTEPQNRRITFECDEHARPHLERLKQELIQRRNEDFMDGRSHGRPNTKRRRDDGLPAFSQHKRRKFGPAEDHAFGTDSLNKRRRDGSGGDQP